MLTDIAPSCSEELRKLWRIFDDAGAEYGPGDWPRARALRGENLMPGVIGVYTPHDGPQHIVRITTLAISQPNAPRRVIAMMQDTQAERHAQQKYRDHLEQRFVETVIVSMKKALQETEAPEHSEKLSFNRLSLALDASAPGTLSAREEEVLRMIALGHTQKDVAARLGIAPKTVEFHRAGALKKIGAVTRVDLIRHAIVQGWMRVKD